MSSAQYITISSIEFKNSFDEVVCAILKCDLTIFDSI